MCGRRLPLLFRFSLFSQTSRQLPKPPLSVFKTRSVGVALESSSLTRPKVSPQRVHTVGMFGRVRPPASSPDTLERPPSKILKSDPLSVYETTLMKLKMGSRRDISPPPETTIELDISGSSADVPECSRYSRCFLGSSSEDTIKTDGDCPSPCLLKCSLHREETMMMDTDSSSANFPSSSSDCKSTDSSNQQNGDVSVIYMFSKFKSARHGLNLSPGARMLETEGSSTSLSD